MTGIFTLKANAYTPVFYLNEAKVTNNISRDTVPPVSSVSIEKGVGLINDTLAPQLADTVIKSLDSLRRDSSIVDTFNVKFSPDTLDAPVKSNAADSIVLDVPNKNFYLYGKATADYKDINLQASKMMYDQATGILTSTYTLDTADQKVGRPLFKQEGQEPINSDTMRYNFQTKKGKIINTVSQQGEGFIHSEEAKKVGDNSYFGYRNSFTTCDIYPPDFAFIAKKIKIIPNKLMISGPAHLEIEGVPTPLFIPFAIFPITKGQRTGLLPPSYVVTQQKGIGLENGGYYLGLGEHFDLTTRVNVYSYGSWTLDLNPTYRKRYHYSGAFDLSIATTKFGVDKKTPDYSVSHDFRVSWQHSLDSKARPGVGFNININAGTSTYNQYNVINPEVRLNNTLSSSVSFSKVWQNSPFALTLSASHSQNTTTRDVSITFPEAALTMNTIYPFQPKELTGTPKWYQKIGIGYTLNARNSVNFIDSTFLKGDFFNKFQSGIQHQVPISLTLPALKFLTISPSVGYTERWYTKKLYKTWNPKEQGLDTTYTDGFYTARQITTGLSFSSAVYGMLQFKHSKIKAIRHVMRPSISFNYTPDLNKQFYYTERVDTGSSPYAMQRFSVFDGSLFGPFSEGTFGGMSFSIDNNLEMKVFSKKDTATHSKKIKLLDGFGINGSYNFVADSFKLTPFSIYARTNLFDKINISANGTIDPYVQDAYGHDVDEYIWSTGRPTIGRLTNGSVSMSTSFKSKERKNKTENTEKPTTQNPTDPNDLAAQQRDLNRLRANPGEYADFNIPWNVSLSYSLNFNKTRTPDYKRDTTIYVQNLSFNGDFNLTPKWKIGINSGVDFLHGKLNYTQVYISRDLHCWQMTINLVPLGSYKYFSITLAPKAGILHDLHINRTRQFQDVFAH